MGRVSKQDRIYVLEVENWNLKNPIGTAVKLKMDSGEERITKTRSEAFICNPGYPAAFFDGVAGYYLLERANTL